jgi:CPA2 family monovalent cation:H+ antiporter-2
MEAGLEITRQALLHLQVPVTVIQQYTDTVRQQLYAPIYKSHYDYRLLTRLDNIKDLLEISWVRLPPVSPLVNATIKQMAIRKRTGASVVGIIHGGVFKANPGPDFRFASDDLVAVVGNPQERAAFTQLAEVNGLENIIPV